MDIKRSSSLSDEDGVQVNPAALMETKRRRFVGVFLVTLAHYDCGMKGEILKEHQSSPADSIHVAPQHLWEVFLSHLRCDHLALAPEPHMSDNPCSATKADAGI